MKKRKLLTPATLHKGSRQHSVNPLTHQKVNFNIQIVKSAPSRLLIGTYLTNKGLRIQAEGKSAISELKKYTKNRYVNNPKSKDLKYVFH